MVAAEPGSVLKGHFPRFRRLFYATLISDGSVIAAAPGETRFVQIFENGHDEFSTRVGHVAGVGDGERTGSGHVFGDQALQLLDPFAMQENIRRDRDQVPAGDCDLGELIEAVFLRAGRTLEIVRRRRLKAGIFELADYLVEQAMIVSRHFRSELGQTAEAPEQPDLAFAEQLEDVSTEILAVAAFERLSRAVFHAMIVHGAKLEKKQAFLGRIVDIGTELFMMSAACVYAKRRMQEKAGDRKPETMADLFCRGSRRRIAERFRALWRNDDVARYRVARSVLKGDHAWLEENALIGEPARDRAAVEELVTQKV